MEIMSSDELEPALSDLNQKHFHKRFSFDGLLHWLTDENDNRIMALYGLRRTGKTTMMLQAVNELDDLSHTLWIQCEAGEGNRMEDLKKILNAHPDAKYIFIDEITKMDNFIQTGSILADKYARKGQKIVITGTDSLSIFLARSDELLQRMNIIHTTYIPYDEYAYLMQARTLDYGIEDYIEHGGTLTDGKERYNKDNIDEYTNSAIAMNIEHSLARCDRDGRFGLLIDLYDRNLFSQFVNKVIELHNRTFLLKTIRNRFKSHDFGSIADFVEKGKIPEIEDALVLQSEETREEIRKLLGINDEFNEKNEREMQTMIDQMKKYLEFLDVLIPVPDSREVIFTQPGIRYSQLEKEKDFIFRSELLNAYTTEQKAVLAIKLESDIRGQLFEDIVFYGMLKNPDVVKEFNIFKYDGYVDGAYHEFDMVLSSKTVNESYVFEIKHSAQTHQNQRKHLSSDSFCHSFEEDRKSKIMGKILVYSGNPAKDTEGISYECIEDFLKQPLKALKRAAKVLQWAASCVLVR